MSIKRTLLALGVLAAIMLFGCKQPVGLPGKVRTASVAYCTVDSNEAWSGSVAWFFDSPWDTGDTYVRHNPLITWLDDEYHGHPQPRRNGFCIFRVPNVEPDSQATPFACTLHYRQKEYCRDTLSRLIVTRLHNSPLSETDSALFWDAWEGDIIASDVGHDQNIWYEIPLSSYACQAISLIAYDGGGYFYTGWITPDTWDYIFATAYGAGSLSPYIEMFHH